MEDATNGDGKKTRSKPIADLFPEATVYFADIAGFTAWSSSRDPVPQVSTLLETIYGEFDAIAKRRGVFKVETIGDCYLAVTGLPEPRKEHTSAMCRFAKDRVGARPGYRGAQVAYRPTQRTCHCRGSAWGKGPLSAVW